jgi:hypothetical protein
MDRVKIPFGFNLTASGGGSAFFRAPTGYVFEDFNMANFQSSYLKVSLSRDREAETYRPFSPTDLSKGNLPASWDFETPILYWTSSQAISYEGIGQAEFRSLQMDHSGGFSNATLVIWGTYIKDPRCYD